MNKEIQTTSQITDKLEQRLSDLARQKSRLELINHLLTSLSSVAGLDNMVQHILNILMQTVGAANISIIYRLDDIWQFRDVYGTSQDFDALENPDIITALDNGKPLKIGSPDIQIPYPGECGAVAPENWIFPLLCRDHKVGVISMDGMQLTDQSIFDELTPFFVYAGLMLDNEISNYSKLAEAHRRLMESETLYRTLFEQSPEGVVLWSVPDFKPIQFNSTAHTLLGYSREEFEGLTFKDLHRSDDPIAIDHIKETLHRQGAASFEAIHCTKTGDCLSIFVSLKMFELADRKVILAIHHNITELKESNRNLELYRHALDNARDSIFLMQSDARFLYVNKSACETLGYTREEFLAMQVFDIDPDYPRETWGTHWRHFSTQSILNIESRHRTKDGRLIPVEIGLRIFGFEEVEYLLAAARDLTERRQFEAERLHLEQQLLHAQKLESLGVLAGGIAHDFNNILMAILGNAELALMRINKESPGVDNLHKIEESAARAADLAKQMLAYSGKGKFVVEQINLNRLLEDMMHMLDVSISKKAVLRLNLIPLLPTVEADATQIRQIVMNLVINGSEAIGDKTGVIAITTGCMECDKKYLKDVWLDENIGAGLYVYLEVADTGCGMSNETLSKIFDPFFTTKFTGRGLGMAAVMGIVRSHKGAIKVYSELNKGTSFKILLPASGKPVDIINYDSKANDWKGSGMVLLVDDEETVRGICKEMLQELGFTTITANDGREAVEVFKNTPGIALVILDLTMPHMDGEQCFRELRQLNPDVKVIMSSGFSENEVTQKFAGKGLAGFVQKPYRLSELKEAIAPLFSSIRL
jgi:PAS domain S-box-containing protein